MADISIIIPIYNGSRWIDDCMTSIMHQTILTTNHRVEVVVYNDGSTDCTLEALLPWKEHFRKASIDFYIYGSPVCKGVGAAKNGAVHHSKGEYLCFQDIDDVMRPERINMQYSAACLNTDALIGGRISRTPPGSTPRFNHWANNLDPLLLDVQIYTSNGPTLLMPTWFCHRSVYNKVGGFDESGTGTPEDLIFFYKHLDAGGRLIRVDHDILLYTYHVHAATFSVTRELIWKIQLERIERIIIPKWQNITIWNAGRAGRRFVRALSKDSKSKLVAFCDIDKKKIGRNIELYCPKRRKNLLILPVIHFSEAKPPIIVCVKLGLSEGEFENNLKSLNLIEGKDYIIFN